MQFAAFVIAPIRSKSRVGTAGALSHRPFPTTPAQFSDARASNYSPSRRITLCSMSGQRFNAIHAELTATPSWERLATMAIREDFVNGPNCTTPTKERESIRLFGQKEADVRLVLYRDHAGWCPYCHKVQMLIEAKKIPYVIRKINLSCYGSKPEEYLKMVPSGLLPVILLDGELIKESMDIMFLLEETFQSPHRKLIPTENNDMMQSFHRYVRMERVFTGVWLGCLRGPLAMSGRAMESLIQTLNIIETSLGEYEGPFFYPGEEPSFVDINFSTIFERSRASLKYWRNLEITDGRPRLQRWFEAWEHWGPGVYVCSDDWTHIGALPPQIGPVKFSHPRAPISVRVETERTLHVLNDGPDGRIPRSQAGAAICRNHKAVVKDAIRGGKVPEMDYAHVDNAFRIMSQVLFDPDLLEVLEDRLRKEIPKSSWTIVGNAIRFERARCCAPRDMPIHAMRQFCGAINWLLRTLGQEL